MATSALTCSRFGQRASYFYMPADLQTASMEPGQRIRLGGLVEKGTIVARAGPTVSFAVTDGGSRCR
jgi:cytochrome c-type biogenesis protein CcmE